MNKKILKKFFKRKWRDIYTYYYPKTRYLHYYKTLKIDEKIILLESQHGMEMQGNIFYMIRAMVNSSDYDDYIIYLSCRNSNKEEFRKMLDKNGMERVNLVILSTKRYMKLMASAKYLINDTTFLPFYIKKEGQIYLNTWHGTPLKTLGKKVKNEMYGIGNVQKNFIVADYLLYPNEYTMKHMIEDYMLENISESKILLAGYPRNEVFFDKNSELKIRGDLDLVDKKVYAYMPTWRGVVGAIDSKATVYFKYYLYELDKQLADDEIIFVKAHSFTRKYSKTKGLKHIRPFPKEYETYEFLNTVDCLITDYSSVFYDFALSRKKCILFTYDEEEYFENRGLYKSLSSLPFPNVKTVEELLIELRTPKTYDDTEFLKEYCSYDYENISKILCDRVVLGKQSSFIKECEIKKNGKPNIMLYAGNMAHNGITTSLINLLNSIDRSEYNYYITFRAASVKNNQENLLKLPKGVNYIATTGKMNLSLFKKIVWLLFKDKKLSTNVMINIVKNDLQFELRRIYGNIKFDTIIQFNGYDTTKIIVYSDFSGNNVIYVHNDMFKESTVKKNQRQDVLRYAYNAYEHVAIVTEDLIESTTNILRKTRKLDLAHNLIAYNDIMVRGEKEIRFDSYTKSNIPFEKIIEILNSTTKKIVNVGRFAPEKGQKRLIDAFKNIIEDDADTYLFIIGGYQLNGIYDQLCEYVENSACADRIILILSMSNPLPIVKKCDGFILSSFYEGFGLVLVEADILGLPVVSTDIVGPRTFMQKNNGLLVEDSVVGIEDGLRRLINGTVPKLTVDYVDYNCKAVMEFESLLKN